MVKKTNETTGYKRKSLWLIACIGLCLLYSCRSSSQAFGNLDMLEKTVSKQPYRTARHYIDDGDIALYRRDWKISNKMIAKSGSTPYCHAGLLFWSHKHLMLLETLQFQGGRCTRMSQQVEMYGGKWDIYHVSNKKYNPSNAVQKMLEIVGKKYGWFALLKTTLSHVPLLKNKYPVQVKDFLSSGLPYCSMAVSQAVRFGGVDLCLNRSDVYTEPAHLALAKDTRYRFTLI